jgi:hypothetical protein
MGEFWANLPGMERNFWPDFLGLGSEKGSSRESTGNWVTR